jgi:hypothetical protein
MAAPTPSRVRPPGSLQARRVAVLMLVGLAALTMPFPWVGVALVPLGMAAVESVRGLLQMRAAQASAGSQAWTLAGLVLIVLMIASVAWPFVFFGASLDYQRCLERANTGAARAECRSPMPTGLAPESSLFLGR